MSSAVYYFASLWDLTNRVTASAVDSLPLSPLVGYLCMRRTCYYFASLRDLTNRVTASAVDSLPLAPLVGNLCMRRTYYYFASLCDLTNRVTASVHRRPHPIKLRFTRFLGRALCRTCIYLHIATL